MGVNILPDRDSTGKVLNHNEPFSSKSLAEGKLFRRKHGFKTPAPIAAGAQADIELVVPYDIVKINLFEFTNAREGDTVDFKVYDTPTGAITSTLEATGYTAIPNYMLNQFGFDVELPDGFYRDKSDYDADLIKDMKITITYKNNGSEPITPRGNIVYHQIKP